MERLHASVAHKRAEGPRADAGQRRLIVEHVWPEIDGGRFPIKRTPGEKVVVTADMFADGHDLVSGVLRYRYIPPPVAGGPQTSAPDASAPSEVTLTPLGNDVWTATFTVEKLGRYEYTIEGWVDR